MAIVVVKKQFKFVDGRWKKSYIDGLSECRNITVPYTVGLVGPVAQSV